MDVITAARTLIGDTLAFHLFFVLFGVALPLIILLVEGYGVFKQNERARQLAHTWAKGLVILFIAGAASGMIVAMQFSLLWPKFTAFAGEVVGISFALEGYAFIIEALFLSVYMLSWNKFKPLTHWLIGFPVALGAIASAFFITTVNSWMNTPQGFSLNEAGQPINVNARQAVFNPAAGTEISHSILAYFFATTLVLMGIYAWLMWRRKHKPEVKVRLQQLLAGLAALAVIFGVAVGLTGHRSGQFLAKHEPAKLAAATALHDTSTNAPLIIGGIVDDNEVKYAIKLPGFLSWLATGSADGKVVGLNDIPKDQRPPTFVHYFFDGMVGIGILTTLIPATYLLLRKFRPAAATRKLMLKLMALCAILGIIAVELGWMVTEFGRQPYVIAGIMRTAEAATTSESAVRLAYFIPLFYIVLLILTIVAFKKVWRPMEALE